MTVNPQTIDTPFDLSAPLKLVIWDMDDTFWDGTLSEGGARLNPATIAIVRELANRGIMSSISSKNDFAAVQEVLSSAGIWDLFIFPQISWDSKSGGVETILADANLRPDNTLFIDDNSLNIEEIRFRFPTMMVGHPLDVVPVLLGLWHARGKDDQGHSRLHQYKQLEAKVVERAKTGLTNEDFLRQCDIQIRFDFDIDRHFDRVLELINRSNQLNYTKVRLEDDRSVEAFRRDLQRHDILSAVILAKDRYGDHGLIGFYMQNRNEQTNRLLHYVWSCRMMNVGLEQYVFERLGSPAIDIAHPVSNPISTFDRIDWIRENDHEDVARPTDKSGKVLLLGSCDLTAVASYCGTDRVEYVNAMKFGIMTRYDDFGFVLNDPMSVEASTALPLLPVWNPHEFVNFHKDLGGADILIVSLSAAMKGSCLVTPDGVVARVHPDGLGDYIDAHPWSGFLRGCSFYNLDVDQKIELLDASLALMDHKRKPGSRVFLLGANTRDDAQAFTERNLELAKRYNTACANFCAGKMGWDYVSIDDVVTADKLTDDRHYTRIGYFDIATHINERVAIEPAEPQHSLGSTNEKRAFVDIIRKGYKANRFDVFGPERPQQGFIARSRRVLNRSVKRLLAR